MMDAATHIDTLRVQVPEEAAQRAQLRLSAKLNGADLRPSCLAPAQVLLVRSLSDPAPETLDVSAGPAPDRNWERNVRETLEDCRRRAVRPSNGRVDRAADAVLFADDAEAWACWSRVQAEARVALPWWAQSLLAAADGAWAQRREAPDGLPVATAWRHQQRLVPTITAHLTRWGAVAPVLDSMTDSEATEVLRRVCEAFDVGRPAPTGESSPTAAASEDVGSVEYSDPDPDRGAPATEGRTGGADGEEAEETISDLTAEDDHTKGRRVPDEGAPEASGRERMPDSARPPAPWDRFVDRVAGNSGAVDWGGATPARQELIGVALALYEHPTAVRSRAFRTAWQAWRRQTARASTRRSADRDGMGDRRSVDRSDRSPPCPSPQEEAEETNEIDAFDVERARETDDETAPDDATAFDSGRDGERAEGGAPDETDAGKSEEERAVKRGATHEPVDSSWSGAPVATALGGVFYLIPVLEALDLPRKAQSMLPGATPVGAWALLEALARALLGADSDVRRPHDPLWRVLAGLDGREPDAPAGRDAEGDGPFSFRLPTEWLAPPHVEDPVEGWWTVEGGRLRVWTKMGFVVDEPAMADPAEQAEAAWQSYPSAGPLSRAATADSGPDAPLPDACSTVLAQWAARTAPYLRARLEAVLADEADDADAVANLLTVSGSVFTTDTHVDVVLPLDAARIDVRTAGLDRSPGWWAAGGRVVRLHFVGDDH